MITQGACLQDMKEHEANQARGRAVAEKRSESHGRIMHGLKDECPARGGVRIGTAIAECL